MQYKERAYELQAYSGFMAIFHILILRPLKTSCSYQDLSLELILHFIQSENCFEPRAVIFFSGIVPPLTKLTQSHLSTSQRSSGSEKLKRESIFSFLLHQWQQGDGFTPKKKQHLSVTAGPHMPQ